MMKTYSLLAAKQFEFLHIQSARHQRGHMRAQIRKLRLPSKPALFFPTQHASKTDRLRFGIAQNESLYLVKRKRQISPLQAAISACSSIMRQQMPDWLIYLLPLLMLKYFSEFPFTQGQLRLQFPQLRLGHLRSSAGKNTRYTATQASIGNFFALYERREQANIGELIDTVLAAWEQANPQHLSGLFRHLQYAQATTTEQGKSRQRLWRTVLAEMTRFELSNEHSRAEFCIFWQQLLRNTELSPNANTDVYADLLSALCLAMGSAAASSVRINDPFCGNGELLQALAQKQMPHWQLSGQTADAAQLAHARMGLLMFGGQTCQFQRGNSLSEPRATSAGHLQTFDWQLSNLALASPQWSMQIAKQDHWQRFHRGLLPKGKAELACLCHMLETSSANGRVAVLMRSACLFRKAYEQTIRQKLLAEDVLDTVILLPTAKIARRPLAIVLLQRQRPHGRGILMLDARALGAGTSLHAEQIEGICHAVQQRSSLAGFAALVSQEQITAQDDNWMPSAYLQPSMPSHASDTDDLNQVEIELSQIKQALAQLEKRLGQQIALLKMAI